MPEKFKEIGAIMTPKERYKKAGFKFDVFKNGSLSTIWVVSSEAEAWSWIEENFPLPDIEAIKKKWQKEEKKHVEAFNYYNKLSQNKHDHKISTHSANTTRAHGNLMVTNIIQQFLVDLSQEKE